MEGSLHLQSANLEAKLKLSNGDFLRVASLAFLAAIRARDANKHLSIIAFASLGFSKKCLSNASPNN